MWAHLNGGFYVLSLGWWDDWDIVLTEEKGTGIKKSSGNDSISTCVLRIFSQEIFNTLGSNTASLSTRFSTKGLSTLNPMRFGLRHNLIICYKALSNTTDWIIKSVSGSAWEQRNSRFVEVNLQTMLPQQLTLSLRYLSLVNRLELPLFFDFDLPPFLKRKTHSCPHFRVNKLRVFIKTCFVKRAPGVHSQMTPAPHLTWPSTAPAYKWKSIHPFSKAYPVSGCANPCIKIGWKYRYVRGSFTIRRIIGSVFLINCLIIF